MRRFLRVCPVRENDRLRARLTEVLSSGRHGLPDDLVRLEEEGWGNGEAEGLGGVEVDHQLKCRRLLQTAPKFP
jgi:hypothetical protein